MLYITAGESHGRAVLAMLVGVPAGLELTQEDLDRDLRRRQVGYGRGGRMAIEADSAEVISGVRHGRTLGSPVTIQVRNRDWANWETGMSPFGAPQGDRVTAPRPGHADLAGVQKTGAADIRDVLERASARETAARVAAGGVARAFLRSVGVCVHSAVVAIGDVALGDPVDPGAIDVSAVEASDVRCPDEAVATRMRAAIDAAREDGESLGGIFVVWADGLVPGIGGFATGAERLDGRLAGALVSIPAIKAFEIGAGFAGALRRGSEVHDEIVLDEGRLRRSSNRAGGIEGGMTNGETIVLKAGMKPIPTLMRSLRSVDIDSGERVEASRERSDVCAVPAAAVVAEAETALVLADAYTAKFGQDSMDDLLAALAAYRTRIDW